MLRRAVADDDDRRRARRRASCSDSSSRRRSSPGDRAGEPCDSGRWPASFAALARSSRAPAIAPARRCACRQRDIDLELEIDRIDRVHLRAVLASPCGCARRAAACSWRGLQPTSTIAFGLFDVGDRHRERHAPTAPSAKSSWRRRWSMLLAAAARARACASEMAFLVRRRRMHQRAELAGAAALQRFARRRRIASFQSVSTQCAVALDHRRRRAIGARTSRRS